MIITSVTIITISVTIITTIITSGLFCILLVLLAWRGKRCHAIIIIISTITITNYYYYYYYYHTELCHAASLRHAALLCQTVRAFAGDVKTWLE